MSSYVAGFIKSFKALLSESESPELDEDSAMGLADKIYALHCECRDWLTDEGLEEIKKRDSSELIELRELHAQAKSFVDGQARIIKSKMQSGHQEKRMTQAYTTTQIMSGNGEGE
ncbi:hypothetical protein AB4254_09275 [Vibrio breoganii]